MGISPSFVGYLAPAWVISLVPDTGVLSVAGLTTGSFSLLLVNAATGAHTTGSGVFSAITAAVTTTVSGDTVVVSHASVTYQVVSGDVVAGNYDLWVLVTFSNGVQPFHIGSWQVLTL